MTRAAGSIALFWRLAQALPETAEHSRRVARLGVSVGAELRLGPERLRELGAAALLHDIGKLWVPREILGKPGPLTDEERRTVNRHSLGSALLALDAGVSPYVVMLVLLHHERADGSGPLGLAASDVPLEARLLATCDVYDALRSDRPYRQAWPPERALGFLRRQSGCLFDAGCVEALARVVGARLQLGAAA